MIDVLAYHEYEPIAHRMVEEMFLATEKDWPVQAKAMKEMLIQAIHKGTELEYSKWKSFVVEEKDQLKGQVFDLTNKNKLLIETVEFYETGFTKKLTESMMGEFTPALVDRGARAQATMKKVRGNE